MVSAVQSGMVLLAGMLMAGLATAACAQQPPPPPPVAANPPPPPPPPPPPVYTVYFDYNSSLLTPSGREIIRLAAESYNSGNPASVQVTGFADPSGSAGYNQKLSLKRASVTALTGSAPLNATRQELRSRPSRSRSSIRRVQRS